MQIGFITLVLHLILINTMKIPLASFEQVIDETILKRGFSYYKNDYVMDFEKTSPNRYKAIVLGTEEYSVELELKDSVIVDHSCDCPYDMGPVCKHIVAVIFYLQKEHLTIDITNVPKVKKTKTKSAGQQVKDLLKVISHNDLVTFIEESCKKDKKFRGLFLSSFGHLAENQSKEFFQKQINSILRAATGRDGWIGWNEMKYLCDALQPFVENAEKYLEDKNYESAMNISTALLEEMTEAFNYADDSNGDIGYFIDVSLQVLDKLSSSRLPKVLKNELFDYCISAFNKGFFKGWDWHLGILDIACELIETEGQVETALNCLDSVSREYEMERAQAFKLKLLRKFKPQGEVDRYIDEHINNSGIRRDEIARALENKIFDRAIKLAKDGIEYNKKDKPGLVTEWYNWLLKIAQAQDDKLKIIEYARYLLVDDFRQEQDYYKILKGAIDKNDWHPFLEEIIKEVEAQQKRSWGYSKLVKKIYIEEEWWDRLFGLLKQSLSLENIEEFEPYLAKDYAPELIDFYCERIISYLDRFMGRNHYQTACRYLRRMKKLGGSEDVSSLVATFKKKYPKRKALMEELSEV